MAKGNGKKAKPEKKPQGITHVTVGGYKSIAREQTIEIRPLTVLAGANSSGKSSMVQPLLLLKQTVEAPFDPGSLRLDGPNVKFTSTEQMLPRIGKLPSTGSLVFGITVADIGSLRLEFSRDKKKPLDLTRMTCDAFARPFAITPTSWPEEFNEQYHQLQKEFLERDSSIEFKIEVERDRFLFDVIMTGHSPKWDAPRVFDRRPAFGYTMAYVQRIHEAIHLPGLRGNPERAYPIRGVGAAFPGTFAAYVASVIANWRTEAHDHQTMQLNQDLENLGLTWKVETKPIDDTQVEIRVGRLTHSTRGGAHDLVNIADVGFGVSQTLPVVVALLIAENGQLVYLEQPEIHMHPRAQVAMAQLLANAANRGVRVVVETHSSLLLLGIQSLIAEKKLTPDIVILHWFERDDEGATNIRTVEPDEAGRLGDWPEDFDDVTLEAQARYLNAVEKQQVAR